MTDKPKPSGIGRQASEIREKNKGKVRVNLPGPSSTIPFRTDWLPDAMRNEAFWFGAALSWVIARLVAYFDPLLFDALSPITLIAASVVAMKGYDLFRRGLGLDQ